MGIRIYKEPELEKPILIACWPGIGNIGLIAVDTLRAKLGAEEFAEIEPWEFFYPKKLIIRSDELIDLEFPGSKFYFKRTEQKDLIFFIGEEQPAWGGRAYAEGSKAYQMANLVLDIALKYGCQKIYTSGAAVTSIHHTMKPKVWAVPNTETLIHELKGYDNTLLMSDIEGMGGHGNISGLNGLLLGVAKKRGLSAICLMGEIPIYLQGFPIIYPKASKSVLELLTYTTRVSIDMTEISDLAERSEIEINKMYEKLPPDAKEQLDRLKTAPHARNIDTSKITEEDKKKILEDIDKFFQRGSEKDGN